MSVARKIDMMIGNGILDPPDLIQELYVGIERGLRLAAANGICNIIASQTNNGGADNLANYHDEANPAGENSFIVAEFDQGAGQTWYVLVQYADGATFGNAPGNPGLLRSGSGDDGIGIQMAVRDGGGNPWNGTTNEDGQDTKGATVWTGADVRVFPRSNATGGNDVTNKESCAEFVDFAGSNVYHRAHFACDEDCLYLLVDISDNNTYSGFVCGHYTPPSGLVATLTTPYFMIADDLTAGGFGSGPFGDTAGTQLDQGGISGAPADDVLILSASTIDPGNQGSNEDRAALQPNNVRVGFAHEPTTMSLLVNEGARVGLAGVPTSPFVAEHFGSRHNHVFVDESGLPRTIIGGADLQASAFTFPWDTGAAPSNNRTREGRESFSA